MSSCLVYFLADDEEAGNGVTLFGSAPGTGPIARQVCDPDPAGGAAGNVIEPAMRISLKGDSINEQHCVAVNRGHGAVSLRACSEDCHVYVDGVRCKTNVGTELKSNCCIAVGLGAFFRY